MTKLHLGCGTRYLQGYINIDYPSAEHSVADVKVDIAADITTLAYSEGSVEEIRSHHVFEHFQRPTALALICRWRNWLKVGGLLRIETPDAMASARLMTSPFHSYDAKQQVMRHLFGSHEAAWGVHADGWYKQKFEVTLRAFGFENLSFAANRWGMLRNIEVFAQKNEKQFDINDYSGAVKKLLTNSTVRVRERNPGESESRMLAVWMKIWKETYEMPGIKPSAG